MRKNKTQVVWRLFLILFVVNKIKENMEDRFKKIVWDAFRNAKARPGHFLFMRAFKFGAMRNMNPEEQKRFMDTLNDMIDSRLIAYESGDEGMDLLRLTEQGYEELYNCRSDAEIAKLLLNEFKKGNHRVNEIIPMRQFNFNFIPRLNPKEQDRFVEVANTLILNGYISYEDGKQKPIEGLVLQQAGYNYIYGVSPSHMEDLFN